MAIEVTPTLFRSECGKIVILIDQDTCLGQFHDFLLNVKGQMVDRMVKLQKQEEALAQAQAQMQDEQMPEEPPCSPCCPE